MTEHVACRRRTDGVDGNSHGCARSSARVGTVGGVARALAVLELAVVEMQIRQEIPGR